LRKAVDPDIPILKHNNTCSSSHGLDAMFINAGARAYIGTLWSVGTESATVAANAFYDEAVRTGSVLDGMMAIHEALARGKYANTYIYWGLHFGSLRIPETKSDERLLQVLVRECFLWMKKIAATKDAELKRHSIPVARFLLGVITSSFNPERLAKFVGLDTAVIEEEERGLPVEVEDTLRGADELDLP